MYGIHDVTPEVPQKACWGEFSTAIYGNVAYIQMAAAFEYRGCLYSNLEFQPFQQLERSIVSVALLIEITLLSHVLFTLQFLEFW